MATLIIGIDPGLQSAGWGLVRVEGNRLAHVAHGTLTTSAQSALADRLASLYLALSGILDEYRPQEAAVEETFVNRDSRSALKLAQARAIALLVPAQRGLVVGEYAANLVKKSVVGAGHADKAQVRLMVERLLPGVSLGSSHEADALAVAITHAHHREAAALLARRGRA